MRYLPLLFMTALLYGCKISDYASDSMPVEHRIWDSLLQKHVTEDGLVNYEGFIADSARLNDYLDVLRQNHPNDKHWSRDEQLAYWINAYNAFTVKLVADHYPVESIKDIKNGIPFVNTVWDIKFIEIEGRTYDLNNIEHGIIRPGFEEPRIHFAVNCAAISCPKLSNRAYMPGQLDAQLTQAAKDFLAQESKNQLSPNSVRLSKIYTWYGGDFKTNGQTIIGYINQYAPIEINEDAEISYLEYNWSLNAQ
ncbi:MAG: DUF547 domain-containing protein [Phaeodactylibacter sp.]|uniref:DUF547 domain-containing protein n=1 Tax=Phaeodactylibacter sp. TaxID=1940289 RepID=UPI0032EB6FD3